MSHPGADTRGEPVGTAGQRSQRHPGRVITVLGARTGVGASTVTAYTAAACAALLPARRVASDPEALARGTPAVIAQGIGELRARVDLAIIDARSQLTDRALTALDAADILLLVVRLDVPHLRSAQRLLATFRSLDYPDEKLRVVANRCRLDDPIAVDEAARVLRHPLFWRLPHDQHAAAVNGGKGGGSASRRAVRVDASSPLYAAVLDMSAALLGAPRPVR
jgi:Flp pilus assembly CpaE family ATPase